MSWINRHYPIMQKEFYSKSVIPDPPCLLSAGTSDPEAVDEDLIWLKTDVLTMGSVL